MAISCCGSDTSVSASEQRLSRDSAVPGSLGECGTLCTLPLLPRSRLRVCACGARTVLGAEELRTVTDTLNILDT